MFRNVFDLFERDIMKCLTFNEMSTHARFRALKVLFHVWYLLLTYYSCRYKILLWEVLCQFFFILLLPFCLFVDVVLVDFFFFPLLLPIFWNIRLVDFLNSSKKLIFSVVVNSKTWNKNLLKKQEKEKKPKNLFLSKSRSQLIGNNCIHHKCKCIQ